MDISKVDVNFSPSAAIARDDMVMYNAESAPFKLYGVYREGEQLVRLPQELADRANEGVGYLCGCTAGGRVRFMTDSPYVAVSAHYRMMSKMPHMAFFGSIGMDLFDDGRFVQTIKPEIDCTDTVEGLAEFRTDGLHEVTLNLPLYSWPDRIYIGLKEGCTLREPKPYTIETPIVFYGSSITQGACASRAGSCYTALLARWLDCNHLNLGFSGSCRGEACMAEYIADLDMSLFVYDYDYNARSVEELEQTHEPLFLKVREKHPDLPVVMLSRPQPYPKEEEVVRREVVRRTYEHAVARGDRRVWFVAGGDLIDADCRDTALVDNAHPTDAGFLCMARNLYPLLESILYPNGR